MPINYALFENSLTGEPNDYTAQVQTTASLNLDDLIQRVIQQGSTSTEADIVAVLEDIIKVCKAALLDGNRVNFGGLVELFPRVRGIFHGITDDFDPARHKVDVGANPGSRVRNHVRARATVQKVETILPAPTPLEYLDLGSGDVNHTLTPGTIGTINGSRLKFDDTRADEGIFFIDAGGTEHKVALVQKNKPSQLVFLVPDTIPAGNLTLEVRARMRDSTELRTGHLDATLNA
jgi:hypothetical protein